ncbi:hypothetical protein J2S09_004130 [Bacillus fengqiuensis]|nr:hypothetical protein [Bacillus fengqiuensis]
MTGPFSKKIIFAACLDLWAGRFVSFNNQETSAEVNSGKDFYKEIKVESLIIS